MYSHVINIFLFKLGPFPIIRGEVAKIIHDWGSTRTVAFEFKINSRSRGRRKITVLSSLLLSSWALLSGRRMIAVLSDLGGNRCCSYRNALFSVSLGSQTLSWAWEITCDILFRVIVKIEILKWLHLLVRQKRGFDWKKIGKHLFCLSMVGQGEDLLCAWGHGTG